MDDITYGVQFKERYSKDQDWELYCSLRKTSIEAHRLFAELVRGSNNNLESARVVSMWLVGGRWQVKDVLMYRDLPKP